ncbi:LuxR C-terminal-related transcriptional regulator [Cytobacillus praedii]|uniref:LuxR C-terminal-related transcriptional regulator n=1 Tax=Cytobacillus praedii TaxID=1742358 RepID=UPI003AF94AFE
MKQQSHDYEEIDFEQFIIFIKSHSKQIRENITIYKNLEPTIIEEDRILIGTLLDSFIHFLSHSDIEDISNDYEDHLDIWLQSQITILNTRIFNYFFFIFEKSVLTLMANLKQHNRNIPILMFLSSLFSHLFHSYSKRSDTETEHTFSKNAEENEELRRLYLLDQLNEILISTSGSNNLAHILKKCEDIFHYKRCVFYAYIPWSNQFYGVIGSELTKVQSMRGQLNKQNTFFNMKGPIFLKNPHNYVREEHIKLFNLSSVIFVPIFNQQQLLGWLTFDQLGEEFDCSKEELILLEQAGKRIGLYLSRNHDERSRIAEIQLTERETMILDLLADGYDNKKMGELLHLSEHTVRDYISSLMTKLHAKNRTQVVASAFRLGLIE